MNRLSRFPLLLLVVLLASAPAVIAQHWNPDVTDGNMSVFVEDATLDGERLVTGDEIGVFTPAGDLGGAGVITDDGFPIGLSAWQDERDVEGFNGFRDGEEIFFKVWDHQADEEWSAEIEVTEGAAEFHVNEFAAFIVTAARQQLPDINIPEDNFDFGIVRVGRAAVWNATIENTGNAVLTVESITSGDDAFTTNFGNAVEVAAGEALGVEVAFEPGAAGDFATDLTIVSDDADEDTVMIHLAGVGEEPRPPEISLSVDERRFGRILVGNSRNLSLYIFNTGDLPLEVTDVTTGDEAFSIDFDPHFEIGGGERFEVVVTFNPQEARAYESELTITSNDQDENVISIPLYGEGLAEGAAAVISVMAEEHFYGAVIAGQSAEWRLVVTNVGGSDLMVTDVSSDNGSFTVEFGNQAVRLRPGDYLFVNTSFNPAAEGFYEGTITVTSDDEENGEIQIPVGGVSLIDNEHHFQAYNTGLNHSFLVTATTLDGNRLGEGAEVAVFTRTGYCAGYGTITQDGQVGIAAYGDDESTDIIDGFVANETISFKVWDPNSRTEAWASPNFEEGPEEFSVADMTILSLAANTGEPQPDISLSDNVHFFGQVAVGESESWDVTITNRGRGALHVTNVEPDLNEFTTDFDGAFELNLGESRTISVTFSPTEFVDYEGRLTVASDDPIDSVLYVDLFARGVDVVREPEIDLPAENHFFGVVGLNQEASYVLHINNIGGGLLRIDDIAVEGANAFTTNWPGRPEEIDPDGTFDLTVNFRSAQAGTFQANLVITSDDPNNDVVRFLVEATAVNEASHFHRRITGGSHGLIVNHAILRQPGDRENPLAPGDEIAVFTPAGLCAGSVVIEEQGAAVGIAVYGDDRNTPVVDGFVDGEGFTFRYFDDGTNTEVEANATYTDGPNTFTLNEVTELDLDGFIDVDEAQIAVDPMIYQFGATGVNTNLTHDFTISNTGGVDLTVSRITSNMNVFTHNFNNQPTVIHPGESIEVTVTFRPTDVAVYEGIMTVFSDDNDQAQFTFRPNGMGSAQRGHYHFLETDGNHSILVENFRMGDAPAPIGDQVGVFTQAGLCAGAGTVTDPGSVGLPAWHDDGDTDFLVEGFNNGEAMTLRVWDASQGREYTEFEPEVVEGELVWEANGFTVVNITIPNVISVIANPAVSTVDEGAVVRVRFTIANSPGNMQFTFLDRDSIRQNMGEVNFTDNGNETADLVWNTNFNCYRRNAQNQQVGYVLRVRASVGDVSDYTSFTVNFNNINQRPIVATPFQDNVTTVNEDGYQGDPPRFIIIPNLNQFFVDPDSVNGVPDNVPVFSAPRFTPNPANNGVINEFRTVNRIQLWQIATPVHWFGTIEVTLRADDRVGGVVNYDFTIVVRSVNDRPEITEPTRNPQHVWNINEREDATLPFRGTDVESQGDQITWTMTQRGNLPDEAQFTDNRDGTGQLHWQPTPADIGQYAGLEVAMDDADGERDVLALTINVLPVNDPPEDNPDTEFPDAVSIDEDAADTVIAILNQYWIDPDEGDVLIYGLGAPQPAPLNVRYNNQTTEVTIRPNANINGQFNVPVYCRDNNGRAPFNEVRATIVVTVTPINDPPRSTGVIPNIGEAPLILEDANLARVVIVNVNQRFTDPDVGDVLAYRVWGPQELGLLIEFIQPNFRLSRQFAPNYHTVKRDGSLRDTVTVVAEDQAGDTAFTQFTIRIGSVDDRPLGAGNTPADTVFSLISPADGARTDTIGALQLAWGAAVQNPYELDSVYYRFAIVQRGRQDTVFVPALLENSFVIPNLDSLARRLLPDREIPDSVMWWVSAVDGEGGQGQRFWAKRGPRLFIIPALGIKEIPNVEQPGDYFISNSYPNPFNASTTLKFGLPIAGNVEVSVWDMHGRKVAELAAGHHNAGQYELTWTAQGLTSGIYLIRMQSGAFVGMQKAILVR